MEGDTVNEDVWQQLPLFPFAKQCHFSAMGAMALSLRTAMDFIKLFITGGLPQAK